MNVSCLNFDGFINFELMFLCMVYIFIRNLCSIFFEKMNNFIKFNHLKKNHYTFMLVIYG